MSNDGLKTNVNGYSKRSETGLTGAELVSKELISRGYGTVVMPSHNRGFDINCRSPHGTCFKVEVKCSTSVGTQVPLQIKSHLESPLQKDLLYVFVRPAETASTSASFFLMTHAEIHDAWGKMPRIKPDGTPYAIKGTGYIDWKHINPHLNSWNKLPR